MTEWRHHATARLRLDAVCAADIDEWFELNSDPRVWRHFPSGRHTDPSGTAAQVASFETAWRAGLGYWTVRTRAGEFAGIGGCMLRASTQAWNLYYRLETRMHGRGYASELVKAAVAAATDVDVSKPIVARLLEHNVASRRTAERAGLRLVWRGIDQGNPDRSAIRLVYADRDLPRQLLTEVAGSR